MTADLQDLISGLISQSKAKKPKGKSTKSPSPTPRERNHLRLKDDAWTDQSYVVLTTHTLCKCGATFASPAPHLFLRRFHPKHGIHIEAMCHRPVVTGLPIHVERRIVESPMCHLCVDATDTEEILAQTCFDFTEDADFHALLSQETPLPREMH